MRWRNGEPFFDKFTTLLQLIDALSNDGKTVYLLGTSAGASVALNAFAARSKKVKAIALVAGQILGPQNVHDSVYGKNPAFKESMQMLGESLPNLSMRDRKRILSLHPSSDDSVPIADTLLPGAQTSALPVGGHVPGIAYAITLGMPRIVKFLKNS